MKSKMAFSLVTFAGLAASTIYLVATKSWQRWDINSDWARQVITNSTDLVTKLDDYRAKHGQFPESLEVIREEYKHPPSFEIVELSDIWHYQLLNKDDYQLVATAKSFVSSYDAMVFRKSNHYPDRWFQILDQSHAKKFDDWWYITGFSSLE